MNKDTFIVIATIIVIVVGIAFGNKNNQTQNQQQSLSESHDIITLAGGCFWCIEAAFQEEVGIVNAVSGYSGGTSDTANYRSVVRGATAHRESVQVTYDTEIVTTDEVLDIFWSTIDPTDGEGQFADRGYQYSTAIYYHDNSQKRIVESSKQRLSESKLFEQDIATEVLPFIGFYEAEEYHQDYYKKSSDHYYAYEAGSGRKGFTEETWARDAALAFFETEAEKTVTPRGDYNYTDEEIEILLENLDPLAYHVVAENGTEKPFENLYWNNKEDGIYVDVVTGEALFSSTHKYDSGTGWPAFWRSINDESIELLDDNSIGITRTEVRSNAGHLGHVFNDGPLEHGGERYCINSASLLFVPLDELAEKGYEQYLELFDKKTNQ